MFRSRVTAMCLPFALCVVALGALGQAANTPEVLPSGCHRDQYQQPLCSPPNGGIARDRYGAIVCGVGQCTKDQLGAVMCSVQPGGFATTNKFETAVCIGGCKPALASTCQRPI